MTGKIRLDSRIRWMRLRLRRLHDRLTARTRKRIALGAFLLLMLAYGWVLLRGMPETKIVPIEFPTLKP